MARQAGLQIKLNAVALKGVNDGEFDDLIRWSGDRGFDLALIEVMPMGESAPMLASTSTCRSPWYAPSCNDNGPLMRATIAPAGRRVITSCAKRAAVSA